MAMPVPAIPALSADLTAILRHKDISESSMNVTMMPDGSYRLKVLTYRTGWVQARASTLEEAARKLRNAHAHT